MIKTFTFILIFISCMLPATEQSKKLELGLGAFSTQLPHYLGSDQSDIYLVPLPYVYYLDDTFKVDRNQFTGKLWQNHNFYLDLSASGGVKVNSEDNNARAGMNDLDWVFELGPSIKYYFTGDPQQSSFWYAELFTRKATATDFQSLTDIGWRYGPSMTFQQAYSYLQGEIEFTSRFNINFSDSKYLNYYYGVSDEFSHASRSVFENVSGYSGSDLSVGLTYKTGAWWFGGFARYYNFYSANQSDSPLVLQNSNWALGFGVAWVFYQN